MRRYFKVIDKITEKQLFVWIEHTDKSLIEKALSAGFVSVKYVEAMDEISELGKKVSEKNRWLFYAMPLTAYTCTYRKRVLHLRRDFFAPAYNMVLIWKD